MPIYCTISKGDQLREWNSFVLHPGMIYGVDRSGSSITLFVTNGSFFPHTQSYRVYVSQNDGMTWTKTSIPSRRIFTRIQKEIAHRDRLNLSVHYVTPLEAEAQRGYTGYSSENPNKPPKVEGKTNSYSVRRREWRERNDLTQKINTVMCTTASGVTII